MSSVVYFTFVAVKYKSAEQVHSYLSLLYAVKAWPNDKDDNLVTGNTKRGSITVLLTS
jgi:hypothetical protein